MAALQVHGQAAWKLYLKDSPDGEEKIVEDLDEVRAFMDRIMRPAIRPENIYAHHHDEQDVILWYNRALWHCVVCIPTFFPPRSQIAKPGPDRPNFQTAMGPESCINVMLRPVMTHSKCLHLTLKIAAMLGKGFSIFAS